jgi:hypothetical protein
VLTGPGKAPFHMGIDLCCCVKQGVLFTTESVENVQKYCPKKIPSSLASKLNHLKKKTQKAKRETKQKSDDQRL